MSDARSLLKAKRQEIRIDHPLASYTSNGQLRCIVCETNVKHASAWDGHLVSKAHRTNAARVKEEERRRKELELEEEAMSLKRKVPEDDDGARDTTKKSRVGSASASNLPSDFFSDPSQAPPAFHDSDDDNMDDEATPIIKLAGEDGDTSLDQEWIQFQQSVINAPPDAQATYERATIAVEPELISNSSEGFPADTNVLPQAVTKGDEDERRKKEQEERELIMDRLLDEERAQEEADMRVTIMKNRLDALRKRREATRSVK